MNIDKDMYNDHEIDQTQEECAIVKKTQDMYGSNETYGENRHMIGKMAKECALMLADHLLSSFIDAVLTRYDDKRSDADS